MVTVSLASSPDWLLPLLLSPIPGPVSQSSTQPWREVRAWALLDVTIIFTIYILDHFIIGLLIVALICGAQAEEANEKAERGK